MSQKSRLKPSAIATKIKKWIATAQELKAETFRFALPSTRLTSVKSLCQDERAAEGFAFYIKQQVQQEMQAVECPETFPQEEWDAHIQLMADSINQMDACLSIPDPQGKQAIQALLRQIDQYQGDDYRKVHWNTVHFVRSGYLLKLEYAMRCFVDRDFPYWAYKLARECTEHYEPSYGTGLIPKSLPMLLDIAEFWCQYYLDQSLEEKFPAVAELRE